MKISQIQEARESSGIEEWGAGYYGIDEEGSVVCYPTADEKHPIPLREVIGQSIDQGAQMPLIIRFPQVIKSQLGRMHEAFARSVDLYNYPGRHFGVFPYKVNQRREFIDAIVSCGRSMDWGLEVGSKTEFMAALGYQLSPASLLICNGFKDEAFIRLAFVAAKMRKKVVIVAEGSDELEMIKIQSREHSGSNFSHPAIGLRVRLYSKGSGKWEKSSGETSKFGLTTVELVQALQILIDSDMRQQLKMLHFHIGSQITAIKRFKSALKEAARVYAKVVKMGFKPQYLNIGGGVGVDYDGSRTTSQSSANYTLEEFASDAVYVIGSVCEEEGVSCPDIVTESGRVIAAYHSVVVTDIREVQGEESLENIDYLDFSENKLASFQGQTKELHYILLNINRKNYVEFYHDALQYNEELILLFNLGMLDLEERSIVEDMFNCICKKALYISSYEKRPTEEFQKLRKRKVTKYLANFSIFQSIPDSWAIDQLFPVIPLSRHHEKPSIKGTIVDITCDSDGSLEDFIDQRDKKNSLDLHAPSGMPYYIGFFLVGAYQEALSNEHNLFGAPFETEVFLSDTGQWKISKITKGDPIDELLTTRNYSIRQMLGSYKRQLKLAKNEDFLSSEDAESIYQLLKTSLSDYPYLRS